MTAQPNSFLFQMLQYFLLCLEFFLAFAADSVQFALFIFDVAADDFLEEGFGECFAASVAFHGCSCRWTVFKCFACWRRRQKLFKVVLCSSGS